MIIRLETDEWEKRNNVGISVDNPNFEQIIENFNKLDGANADSLILFKNDKEFMSISDGSNGKYVVMIVTTEKTWELSNGTNSKNRVVVSIGGQDGEVPQYMIVNRTAAEKAIGHYLENALPNPELEWREWDGTC